MKIRLSSGHFKWVWILTLLFAIGAFCCPVASAEDFEFAVKNPAPIGPPESIAADGIEPDEFTYEPGPLAPEAANIIEGINGNKILDLSVFAMEFGWNDCL